jgi:hypothetical protein
MTQGKNRNDDQQKKLRKSLAMQMPTDKCNMLANTTRMKMLEKRRYDAESKKR